MSWNLRDGVEAAQRGDQRAFAELVERHYGTVFGVAFATVREWGAAQDVAQDAFVSAWSHLSLLRQPEAFPMWIRKIARNLALNWRKSDQYRRRLAERYSTERQDGVSEADAASALVSEERRESLLRVMETLSQPVAEVMVLHYLQERSVLEISLALGVSESAVKKRLQRGREALRDRLEASWKADLETPSHPDRAKRVLMGLSAGPAMPALSQKAAAYGPLVLAHHVVHGGALKGLQPAMAAGMVGGVKTLGVVAVLVAGAAVLWFAQLGDGPASGMAEGNPGQTLEGSDPVSLAGDGTTSNEAPVAASGDDALETASPGDTAPVPDESGAETGPDGAGTTRIAQSAQDERAGGGAEEEPPATLDVNGVVVTEWDEPVADVRVVAMPVRRQGNVATLDELATDAQIQFDAKTGPGGSFSFSGPSDANAYRVMVVDREYAGESTFGIPEGNEPVTVRIVAKRGVPLDGRLVTPAGQGAPGALVESTGLIQGGSARGGPLAQSVTDGEGYFTLLLDTAGEALVRAVAKDYGEQIFTNVPVGAPEIVTLTLEQPARVSGTVTTASGEPIAGAWVVLESEQTMTSAHGSSVSSNGTKVGVRSDEMGFYVFEQVATNVLIDASVRLQEDLKLTTPHTIGPLASGEDVVWDPVLSGDVNVTGIVMGTPSGQPVPGSRVVVFAGGEQYTMVEALPDGRYEVNLPLALEEVSLVPVYALLPAGELSGLAPEIVVNHVLAPGEPNEVDLALPDPFCVSLRAVDGHGAAVGNAGVSVQWRPQENSTYGFGQGWVTGDDGGFTWCAGAPYGEYTFRVRSEGGVAVESAPYTGAPGDAFEEEVLMLLEGGGISGYLIDGATGAPLAHTRILVSDAANAAGSVISSTSTAEDGFFRVAEGIPSTEISVRIRVADDASAGRAEWTSSPLVIEPGGILDLGAIPMTVLAQDNDESANVETREVRLDL